MEPLTCATVGWASRTVNSKLQMALLDQSKTVIESMQNLLVAAKDAGGNRKVTNCLLHIALSVLTMLFRWSKGLSKQFLSSLLREIWHNV